MAARHKSVGSHFHVSFEQMDKAALAYQSDYDPYGVRLQQNENEVSKRSNAQACLEGYRDKTPAWEVKRKTKAHFRFGDSVPDFANYSLQLFFETEF